MQAIQSQPSFKGNLIINNAGTSYLEGVIRKSPIIQDFAKKFKGDIYVDSSYHLTPKYIVQRGGDEEVHKVYLSTAARAKTFWGRLKQLFDPDFRSVSLTKHYRDEEDISAAIANEAKLKANLEKLKK